jgi:hypothetical protein
MAEKIKHITVKGSPNAKTSVIVKNAAGNTYNQNTKTFESGTNIINISIGSNGRSVIPIILPNITSDDTYTLSVKPKAGTVTNSSLTALENYITQKEYPAKTLTWTTSHTTAGYTIAAGLSSSFKGSVPEGVFDINDLESGMYFTLTGAITKSSALLYVTRDPSISRSTGGDFTSAKRPSQSVTRTSPSTAKISIDDDTNVSDGDKVYGENIIEEIAIAKDGSNVLTLSDYTYWPRIEVDQVLYFSEGGYDVDVREASIAGSGTTSLTGTVTGYINRFGYDDDTITWRLQENVTTTPNASDQSVTCVAGATVAVNCGLGDTDANAGAKTYSRVAGPSRGTVGNNSTAFDNNTFTGTSITYNNTSGSATDTDTFTFKSRDAGGTYSATKTITITLT